MQPNDPNRSSYTGGTNGWSQPNTLSNPAQGTAAPVAASIPREGFLTGAFVWMFVGLLLSAGSAWFVMSSGSAMDQVINNWFILLIATFGLAMGIGLFITRINSLVALGLFFAYALLNGLLLGVIVAAYAAKGTAGASAVVTAFLGASAVFAGAALYGGITKRDLTSLRGILTMGLIGLLVVMLVQVFLFPGSGPLNLAIGVVGVLIFTGLTAFDVQRIKNGQMGNLNRDSASVMGALVLYLDFVNLFLMMLRIFGSSR
jgi:FtsH-binding integral membrane protein